MMSAVGLYDTAHVPEVCGACSCAITRAIQFKFGSPRVREYTVGDPVRELGGALTGRYIVAGIALGCPLCGASPQPEDRAVWIEHGTLTAARVWRSHGLFWHELYENDETWVYIEALDRWKPGDFEE